MADLFYDKKITDTLRENYMPYVVSVIVSRAIPEIDGFKPSHRKLLYTMYKMGLLNGERTKSANVVGQTMRLNPHGDAAIYDTLVRLSRGHEALLHPFVDSKGSFGKHYSTVSYAAARYTECRLSPVCADLFAGIDRDAVDLIDNYDGTMKEPALLPTAFPNVLVNANLGIAVGMASNICSFNLAEVCRTAAEFIRDPGCDLLATMPAPDFPGGGQIIYDEAQMREIYRTGRGSFRIRAKYSYNAKTQTLSVTEIPYTTTVEAIMDKLAELVKAGKVREISDAKDLTDKSGLHISIELKRGADPDQLMAKLFKMTPLEDSFGCNFNILINGLPRVMGVAEILSEWADWRIGCLRRMLTFDRAKKADRLHLIEGLAKILLDIDRAVAIIRSTEKDALVVPNLMEGFGIDRIQAEFVAEIKLRNLNREYLLDKTGEADALRDGIADIDLTLSSPSRCKKVICNELMAIAKKYGQPRRSEIVRGDEIEVFVPSEAAEDYPVTVFITRDGYFKKITPLSLRMAGEQKLKEGDEITVVCETGNRAELLVFTDRAVAYKARLSDFADTKASALGDYLPGALEFDAGESLLFAAVTSDFSERLVIFFENGKALRSDLKSFATKTNRKKLLNAYSDKSRPVALFTESAPRDYLLTGSTGRGLIVNSDQIPYKTTRASQGVAVMSQGKRSLLAAAEPYSPARLDEENRYRAKNLPAAGRPIGTNDTTMRLL